MDLDNLLRAMVAKGASDLHLKVGCFPHIRLNGDLLPLAEYGKISREDSLMMAFSIMNNKQKQRFRDNAEADIGYGLKGLGRFRINVFQQRGSVSVAIRAIPVSVLTLDDLHLPKVLEKIAAEPRGLVLVTGTTGSGKSTTLASMINYVNERMTRHIITVEDPIEFQHTDRMSIISQREVSVDAASFGAALRSALRQDPDVILVGEMRDLETIETALLAAETGHLVFSTLHTLDAIETINRIIAVFPSHQQRQIRMQLAMVLEGGDLDAPHPTFGHGRPRPRSRGHGGHRVHPQLYPGPGEDPTRSGRRLRLGPRSTACRPSINPFTNTTRQGAFPTKMR